MAPIKFKKIPHFCKLASLTPILFRETLLEEPTAGVDIELRNNLWELVRELHQKGMVILLTTHYLFGALRLL